MILDIVVIDNSSDYPPLLDYYKSIIEKCVTVIYNSKLSNANDLNSIAPIIEKENSKRNCEYYVVTDSDISLELTDDNLFDVCKYLLNSMPEIMIVGPMLKITDIPSTYIYREYAWKRHVEQFWHKRPEFILYNDNKVFYQHALIDTTFGMLKRSTKFKRLHKGVRLYAPYEAQHLDWYISEMELTDDQKEYFKNTKDNVISHWSSASTKKHKFEYLPNKKRLIYIVNNREITEYKLEGLNPSIYLFFGAVLMKVKTRVITLCKNTLKRILH